MDTKELANEMVKNLKTNYDNPDAYDDAKFEREKAAKPLTDDEVGEGTPKVKPTPLDHYQKNE